MLTKLKTIWQKFKELIITFLIGGTALAAGLGATPEDVDVVIADKVAEIQTLQETDKQQNGKYKYRKKEIVKPLNTPETSYQVDEYETAKGERGYIITIEKTEGERTYRMATSTGIFKNQFDYDWKIIKNLIASTTP